MKKMVIVLAVVLLVGGIFAVAALADIIIDRDVSATVGSDIDANVAVKFNINEDYADVAEMGASGIEFNLDGVLHGDGEKFNHHATFQIGAQGAGAGVFTVTNQTDSDITVQMTGDNGVITLQNADGTHDDPDVLAPGVEVEYHFILVTGGVLGDISETLEIRLAE